MAGHYITYLLGFTALFAYNILDDGYLPFILDVIFVLISIISILTVIILRKSVSARFASEMTVTECGSTASVALKIKNGSRIPVNCCMVKIICSSNGKKTGKYRLNLHIPPMSEADAAAEVPCRRCRLTDVMAVRIYLYDYLKLFILSRRVNISSCILVMPKKHEIDEISQMQKDMDEDSETTYSMTVPGDDPSEIFGIKEYEPGDRIRNIHWKLSAKKNQIMVKEYGMPVTDRNAVIIDNIKEAYGLLYGLADMLISAGLSFTAYYSETERKKITVRTDIYELFAALYRCENDKKTYDAFEQTDATRIFYVADRYDNSAVIKMNELARMGRVYHLIPITGGGNGRITRHELQGEVYEA